MKKSLIATAVASVCAVPMAAQAQPTIYGEFIAGIENANDEALHGRADGDGDTTAVLDTALLGAAYNQDIGNGITFDTGIEFEMIAPTGGGGAVEFDNAFGAFSGDFGRAQIGWGVDSVYYLHVFESVDRGVHYDTYSFEDLDFGASGLAIGDEAEFSLQYGYGSGPFSFNVGAVMNNDEDGPTGEREALDRIGIGATFDAGIVSVGVAHQSESNPGDVAEPSATGFSVSGSAGAFDLAAQYSTYDQDLDTNNTEPTSLDVVASTDFGGGLGGTLGVSSIDADSDSGAGDETRFHAQLTRSLTSNVGVFGQLLARSVDGGNQDDVDPQRLIVGVESAF